MFLSESRQGTTPLTKPKEKYLQAFLWAFVCAGLLFLPFVIYDKGYFLFFGDFNVQQVPFYKLAHEAVRSGDIFWNWYTDLGVNFIGSYSFYLLFSPFFWLTLPFPTSIVPYFMAPLLALKFAVMSLTAYTFITRFVKNKNAALIGALLYAFSGFSVYNIFFNHFHDAMAFFPLLLVSLDELVENNRKGLFAICVALCLMVNYFFFAGQVVFLILYFFLRSRCSDFRVTLPKFLTLFAEALLGTAASAFIVLPTALSIFGNFRLSEHLYGMDLLAYYDRTRIWRILQGFFMIPDSPARPNLFSDGTSKWSSIAGYLPMFSLACVISHIKYRPDTWTSKLIKICTVCAFVPVLNSAFYMFNAQYYARWYYMPILIMALVTVQIFERSDISAVSGFRVCGIFYIAMLIISFLPTKKDGVVTWFGFADHKPYFYISLFISAIFLIIAGILFYMKKNGEEYMKKGVVITISASLISTASTFYFGISEGPYPEKYISNSINDTSSQAIVNDKDFFRTDISENCDNYAMYWEYPSIRCFHSTVSPSVMEFYNSIGVTRDVASRADDSYYALRGLLSVKYFFNQYNNDKKEISEVDMPGFEKVSDGDNFAVYENRYYVPMGFTYDNYITKSRFEKLPDTAKANVLMKAILLDDEQITKYEGLFENKGSIDSATLTKEAYLNDCEERKALACYSFEKSTNGFTAKIATEKQSLVFFSVPYDKGFTAYVNGQKTEIEKVNNGFMAVCVPSGDNTITFSYTTYGLVTGIKISAAAFICILVYILIYMIYRIFSKKSTETLNKEALEIQTDEKTRELTIAEGSVIDISINEEV